MKKLAYLLILFTTLIFGQTADLRIDLNDGDDTTPNNQLTYRVYNYGNLYETLGNANSDTNVELQGSIVTLTVDVEYSTTYRFTVRVLDAQGLQSAVSNAIDYTSPDAPIVATPVLSNFRIEDNQKSRVYFDASSDVAGMTTTGFVISGKTISNLTIDGDGLGGYFTVSSPFTFWDNNTIRLGENDDTSHRQTTLYNFTLEYIQNNIAEPSASTYRYVTASASGGGNGTSEGSAWTFSEAVSNATAGMTVWVKAGDYSSTNNIISNAGTPSSPIKFIGYKTTTGDISTMYYNFRTALPLNTAEMPTISGGNSNDIGLSIVTDNIIVKNLQFRGHRRGTDSGGVDNILVENCIYKDNNGLSLASRTGVGITLRGDRNRGKNIITLDNNEDGFRIHGTHNLAENVTAYFSKEGLSWAATMDYYVTIQGSDNIVRNSHSERISANTGHQGHGIGVRSGGASGSEIHQYNLIEKSYSKGLFENFYVRNTRADYNVIKDCEAEGFGQVSSDVTAGVVFMTNVKNNIYERIDVHDIATGILFYDTVESGSSNLNTENNIVRNSTFDNVYYLINTWGYVVSNSNDSYYEDNKIQNCTFNDILYFARPSPTAELQYYHFNNNEIINCVFNNLENEDYQASTRWSIEDMFSINNSNFFDGYGTPSWATNSVTVNPSFVNATNGDFEPQNDALTVAPALFGAEYDYNKKERASTTTIGAVIHSDEEVDTGMASALFKADFEGTTTLGSLVGDWRYFSGSSQGYTFPTDGKLGMGTSSNAVHVIEGTGADVDVNIVTAPSRNGTPSKMLHQEITTNGSTSTQIPWQFNNVTQNPDEFYMSYWVKVDENMVVDPGDYQYNWRALWQYKTENWYLNDGSGARLTLYAMHFGSDGNGDPIYFWRLILDNRVVTNQNAAQAIVWEVDSTPRDLPRDKWFKLEIYFKFRNDNTGAAWAKINGEKVCEKLNVPTTYNNDDMGFFLTAQIYGEDDGMEQWVDEVEIWNGDPDVTFVNVTGVNLPSTRTLTVSNTSQLNATISPVNAMNRAGKWESSNESVATVNEYGLVTGIGTGSSTVTFTSDDGDFQDTCAITVNN